MTSSYQPGDLISLRSGICLILSVKKRISFYELEVLSQGKIITIVEDGSFQKNKTFSGRGNE